MKFNVLFIKFYELYCTRSLYLSNCCNCCKFLVKSFITFNFVYNYELHLHAKEAFLTAYFSGYLKNSPYHKKVKFNTNFMTVYLLIVG